MNQKPMRPRRFNRNLLACALASCIAVSAPQVLAQSANANLRGQVSGASAGTTVTATNTATGSVRRTTTSADGNYTLVGLEPGVYTIDAGPGTAQTVRLSVASNATLNLRSGGAATSTEGRIDAITITAPALQDIRTSEVGKTISLQQIETVPQTSRNFLEFADAVPGMAFTRDANGRTSLRGGGQNETGTNVYIDGVGQKSYVKKGGVAGQFDSAGNPFPQIAIGEYKVITSNYKAEYGQISSAAVTAVTKSGTNEFEGELFYRYTNQDTRAKRPDEVRKGTKLDTFEKEYGAAFGGPIIRDRLHFFVSYEAKRFDLPATVVADSGAVYNVGLLPAGLQGEYGPTVAPFEEDLYFAKLDWDVTDSDRVAFSAQIRDEKQDGGIGGTNAQSHGIFADNFDHRYSLRWEHSSDRWFNEVLATTEDSFNNPVPLTFGNGIIYTTPSGGPTGTDEATLLQVGGASPLSAQIKGQKGWSIEDNLTFNSFQWHGDHTMKMGVRYKSVDLSAADARDINPQFSYTLGSPTFTPNQPYRAFFTKPVVGLGSLAPSVETNSKQYGIYFQDDWQVTDRLLLNLGLRWDYEEVPAYLDFVTPPNVVAALNGPDPAAPGQTYAQSLARGGININDYISNGSNREAFKDAWAPRLGFSYDLNADEQHVIHGGAGRSYDRNVYDFLQLEVTKSALPQFTVFFRDPATGQCYRNQSPCFDWNPAYLNGLQNLQALVPPGSNAGVEVDLMNNDLKTPYSDQFSLGMSNRIGEWLTDATVTRILSHDGFAFTLGNRYPNGEFFQNGGQPWGNGVPGFGVLIVGNNGIETKTTQLLLSAQKPYSKESGWGTSIAYTFSRGRHNRNIGEHYSFDGATIDDYPFIVSNALAKHRFVATGSVDGPWGITLGAKLVLATPIPINDNVCQPPTQPNTGFCIPAAATAGGNGKFLFGGKVFGYREVDFQATKEFELGNGYAFTARLDLLNAFNFRNYSGFDTRTINGRLVTEYNDQSDITFLPRTVKVELGFKF